jgi:hypothetical protein
VKFDILYLDTVSDNHIAFSVVILLLRHSRVILTLHEINSHFTFKPTTNIRKWIRYVGKRSLIKAVKEFNVISYTMLDYVKTKLPANKKLHCIPGAIFEEAKRPSVPDTLNVSIRVVVPGSIDNRRRNYELVFDLLEEVNQKDLLISFVLLGGISEYGKDILDRCKQYVSKLSNLTFFQTDIIDQPIFDREMDQAHFVLIPSVIETNISDGIPETYGLSISSGTISDVIRHAKPFIVPQRLAVQEDIESACFKYKKRADIVPFLEKFVNNPEKYKEWKVNAIHNSRAYTIDAIRKRNPSLFSESNDNGKGLE